MKRTIMSDLMRAMKNDYPGQFSSIINTKENGIEFKQRMISKLGGFSDSSLTNAYEQATEEQPKFMPNIPTLCRYAAKFYSEEKKKAAEQEKTLRISHEPQPTINCKPLELLAKSKKKDNKKTLKKIKQDHDLILKKYKQKIDKSVRFSDCCFPGCINPGIFSPSTRGSESWYCSTHFMRIA